jgi:hypothetical protein
LSLQYTGGAEDAAPLPNQKFLGDSLYRSSYHSPTKRKEEAGERLGTREEQCIAGKSRRGFLCYRRIGRKKML